MSDKIQKYFNLIWRTPDAGSLARKSRGQKKGRHAAPFFVLAMLEGYLET
jgi:hypothetical protein